MANSSTSPATQMPMPPQIGHLQLHFVLIPLMSAGHLLPMVDMAKLLAQHGVTVTILTTPLNTVRFKSTIDRAVESGLQIRLLQPLFPAAEAGLPEGCENMDSLPSRATIKNFFDACKMLQKPFEELFAKLQPPPSCIISGKNLAWTVETARKFGVPRIFFDGMSCFSFSCTHNLEVSNAHGAAASKFEPFLVPNLPHQIQLTRAQLPESLNPGSPDLTEVRDNIRAAESVADGILVNTFEELEAEYVKMYRKIKGGKVWCIGPVTSCKKLSLDKAERGEKASKYAQNQIRDWLDSFEPNSVVYACLGSICGLTAPQLIELGLGLEASNHPCLKPSLHLGLVVDVLGIGVSVGVEAAVTWGMEEKFKGVVMKRMDVKRAVEKAMEKGEEGKVRRESVKSSIYQLNYVSLAVVC